MMRANYTLIARYDQGIEHILVRQEAFIISYSVKERSFQTGFDELLFILGKKDHTGLPIAYSDQCFADYMNGIITKRVSVGKGCYKYIDKTEAFQDAIYARLLCESSTQKLVKHSGWCRRIPHPSDEMCGRNMIGTTNEKYRRTPVCNHGCVYNKFLLIQQGIMDPVGFVRYKANDDESETSESDVEPKYKV